MKAIKFSAFGEPENVLFLADQPVEKPDPESVRIKVLYGNVNISDLALIRGQYHFFPTFPSLSGAEGVGIIQEKGERVSGYDVGDKVSFYSLYGAWAEEVNVRQKSLVKIPQGLPDEIAAQFFTNPITATALLADAGVREGDTILLTAGASSVGKLIIQFASRAGIRVIATVRSDEGMNDLLELGATAVINVEKENLIREIGTITGRKGVAVVLDSVAGKLASQAMHCLSNGGKLIIYGAMSGERIPLNASLLINKDITISNFWLHRWFDRVYPDRDEQCDIFKKELIENMIESSIKMPVEHIYSLTNIKEAIHHFTRSGRRGKILIDCSEGAV